MLGNSPEVFNFNFNWLFLELNWLEPVGFNSIRILTKHAQKFLRTLALADPQVQIATAS